MMRLFIGFAVLVLSCSAFSPENYKSTALPKSNTGSIEIITPDRERAAVFEDPLAPVGGFAAFYEALNKELKYPKKAKRKRIEGIVKVRLILESNGAVSDLKILSGIGYGCDKEAVRLLSLNHKWDTDKRRCTVVALRFNLSDKPGKATFITSGEKIEPISEEDTEEDGFFSVVEDGAKPIDGYPQFYKFINENLNYPEDAKKNGIEGKVYVLFVVKEDGSLTNVRAAGNYIGCGCDEEAARVVSLSPKWIPGKQRGVAVNQRIAMPITFKLD